MTNYINGSFLSGVVVGVIASRSEMVVNIINNNSILKYFIDILCGKTIQIIQTEPRDSITNTTDWLKCLMCEKVADPTKYPNYKSCNETWCLTCFKRAKDCCVEFSGYNNVLK